MYSIGCGKNLFDGDTKELSFSCQTTLKIGNTTARFGRNGIVVTVLDFGRIDISYESVQEIITSSQKNTLTLVLNQSPRFYDVIIGGLGQRGPTMKRTSSVTYWHNHERYAAHCLVYHLEVMGTNFDQLIRFLKGCNAVSITQQTLRPCALTQHGSDYTTAMKLFDAAIQRMSTTRQGLPFPFLFVSHAMVCNNFVDPTTGKRFREALAERQAECVAANQPLGVTVESIHQGLQKIPYPVPGVEWTDVDTDHILQMVVEGEAKLQTGNVDRDPVYGAHIPDQQARVFKAMITPTTMQLVGPEPEKRNRVLRKFPQHNDYFLRVQFCDEDGQDLQFHPKVSHDEVYNRFRRVFEEGIRVGGRLFEFLGFSHSSLRSHSAWFSAEFVHNFEKQNYKSILKSLGDFDDIRVPAKCAARIGQAFSETPFSVPLMKLGIMTRHIPDVKSADGSRVFSDGVGTIS